VVSASCCEPLSGTAHRLGLSAREGPSLSDMSQSVARSDPRGPCGAWLLVRLRHYSPGPFLATPRATPHAGLTVPCQTPTMARRTPLSSWLYKASRTTRDLEVLGGKNGPERYVKRRIRRVERRKGLGWWFRKTGL